ncbi:MAG: hypothetical protein HGA39_07270 [Coriobacteriia bacterium]|nr:hypothetical protein [Coriobacteriia bacterium]
MNGVRAIGVLRGESMGLVTGVTWVPIGAFAAPVPKKSSSAAYALTELASTLDVDFAFVPAGQERSAEAVRRLHHAGAAAFWSVAGVFGRVADRIGWAEALRATAGGPGALAAALAQELHAALDQVREGVAAEADAVVVADDFAGATGFLISPDFVLDALVPCYRLLAAEAHAAGIPAVFHSDGDVRALYPALKRAGFSGVHLAGLGGDDLEASLEAAGRHGLMALGGIEVAALRREGAARIGTRSGTFALDGGLMVCDDGGFNDAEEVADYVVAVDAARQAYVQVRGDLSL